jgi:hypothetical protein
MISWNRKIFIAAACLSVLPGLAAAQTISFEQAANVTGAGGIEFGVDFDYAHDTLQNQGVGTTFSQTALELPVYVRAGISALEAQLTVPYADVRNNYNTFPQDHTNNGWENLSLMIKSNFIQLPFFNLAVGLNTFFPTGNVSNDFNQGLDLTPFLAADVDFPMLRLHANLGYLYSGQYNATTDPVTRQTIAETTIKPGDATTWALGLELPVGPVISLNAELQGVKYGPAQFNGSDLESSPGTTLSFFPGIQFLALPFKAHLGLELPLERREDRPEFLSRPDWRVLGGVSLQFSMGGPNPNSATNNSSNNESNNASH